MMQRLTVMNGGDPITTLKYNDDDADKIIKLVQNKYSNTSTQRSYLQVAKIFATMRNFKSLEKYSAVIEGLRNNISEELKTHVKSEKEEDNWVSWPDVLAKEEALLEKRDLILDTKKSCRL